MIWPGITVPYRASDYTICYMVKSKNEYIVLLTVTKFQATMRACKNY